MHALDALSREMREAIRNASTPDELRDIELRFLGRKQGKLTAILRGLKDLPADERAIMGHKSKWTS
jgi:phenylalanyl-tRNA synthetase alpha chain